ncbi:MAG: SDR family NAD(P)-dependent oxidoreductase [Bryobacteraceae bacterium]
MRLISKRKPNCSGHWLTIGSLSAAAVFTAAKVAARLARPKLDLKEKVVLITGGSRGLGLSLGFELGALGARLALCARDAHELERAQNQLAERGIDASIFPCDISEENEIEPLVARVLDRFGRIDILINNAGHISVAPLERVQHADFEQAMKVMFWAPVNLTLAVLPHMKQRGSGNIVDITSVGGRVSIPHLLPYCCAKFAFVAFSKGLGAESDAHRIRVLTVVPGLMRTGSYLNAKFKGLAENEFAWFSVLGNLPGSSVSARYASRSIVNALQQNRRTCTISLPAKVLIAADALLPEATQTTLAAINRYLLPASGGRSQLASGKILESSFGSFFQALTSLGKTAAHELNE